MRRITLLVLFLVLCVHSLEAKNFAVGSTVNNLLISAEKVVYNYMPLTIIDKDYYYVDQEKRIIKGIIARDLARTDAEVTVTDGGVGETYVRLHLRSVRGGELNYLIFIFTDNK